MSCFCLIYVARPTDLHPGPPAQLGPVLLIIKRKDRQNTCGPATCPHKKRVMKGSYRGRIAPTPTGHMHLGHARTFWIAMKRAQEAGGCLVYREEDLDPGRCSPDFAQAALHDLRWFGCEWQEGPDVGGPVGPYRQSERQAHFIDVWQRLASSGLIYPCAKSRKDINRAARAPHADEERAEPVYPKEWRPPIGTGRDASMPGEVNWRFRVPDGRTIRFEDNRAGPCAFTCMRDFGDFLVWRKDGVPAYELAVVADDAAMGITEVVRAEDLLLSTARQLLIYEALGHAPPAFCHVPLLCGPDGQRLAKRHGALSLRELRAAGNTPEELRRFGAWREGMSL